MDKNIVKIILIAWSLILLSGCSMTKINQSEGLTWDTTTDTWITNTGPVSTWWISTLETWWLPTLETWWLSTLQTWWINTGSSDIVWADLQTSSEEDVAMKEKIRTLIEKRKIDSKSATGLTEEDITLMEDILNEIVKWTK